MKENNKTLEKIISISGKPGLFKLVSQLKNGFIIEVTIQPDNPEDPPIVFNLDGKPARSLWYLYLDS